MGIAMRGFFKASVLVSLTLSLSLAACSPSQDADLNTPESQNIVGGQEVENGTPLSRNVVLLINSMTSEVCSAALIGGTFAVTAAHCVDSKNMGSMYLFFAAKPKKGTERRQIIAAKVSPYWELRQNEDKNTSDIAVIKFAGTDIPEGYEAAKFLPDDHVLTKGMNTVVLGYGIDNATTQSGAGVLRFTVLKISDPQFSPTELLLDQTQGSSACHGDSGGPAFVYLKDKNGRGQYYLWGVANHSSEDDVDNLCNKSVIYTNATLFATWIELVKKNL